MQQFTAIDIFSGAGGLTLGLKKAGFHTVSAIDMSEDCCSTYTSHSPGVNVLARPVDSFSFRPYEGIDLLAGGPPCQPFSSGGKRLAQGDTRDMLPQFVRAVSEAKPKAFLMENVAGLAGATHQKYLGIVLNNLRELGYSVFFSILNAADYGAPQKRKRLFVIGMRKGTFTFPTITHGPTRETPYVAAGTVLTKKTTLGQPNPSNVIYAKKPDLRPSPYDGHVFNGGGRPINLAEPSHTILASAGGNKTHFIDSLDLVPAYHAHLARGGEPRKGVLEGGRRLTVKESALLQTFPESMAFSGSRSSQYTQIGNAVPPLMGYIVGKSLATALKSN